MIIKMSWQAGALALLLIHGSEAQERPAVMVDISACIDLPSSAARTACYEALADEARARRSAAGALSSSTLAVEPEPAARQGVATSVDNKRTDGTHHVESSDATGTDIESRAVANFGTSVSKPIASLVDGEEGQAELRDRIAELGEREPGRMLITLASGQVWYQSFSGRINLRKGMDVRIYPSPLGSSFRLAGTEGNTGFIQVKRVK